MREEEQPTTSISEIESFIDNLPASMKVPLRKDPLISLKPEEILDQIAKKTNVGKAFFLQIAMVITNRKKNGEWKPDNSNILT